MSADTDDPPQQIDPDDAQVNSPANVLILPTNVEKEIAQTDESLGRLGRPFDHRAS
jgi:hypothetical protein